MRETAAQGAEHQIMEKTQSYWTKEERWHFAKHIMGQVMKLPSMKGLYFVVFVQPEIDFSEDATLTNLKGSTHGGWSVWIRETYLGIPLGGDNPVDCYNAYMETAIHETAHCLLTQKLKKPAHKHNDKAFKANLARLHDEAREAGIWPVQKIPYGLRGLFKQRSCKRMKALIDWVLKQGKKTHENPKA